MEDLLLFYIYFLQCIDYEKAIEFCSKTNPQTFDSLYSRGYAFNQIGRHIDAIEDFNAAEKLALPSNKEKRAHLLYQRAFALHMLGKIQPAVDNYSEYIKNAEYPEKHKGYLGRGLARMDYLDLGRALHDISHAIDHVKRVNSYYHYCRARVFALSGKEKQAHDDIEQGNKHLTDSSQFSLERAIIYYDMKEYDKALEQINGLHLNSDKENAELLFRRGLIHYAMANREPTDEGSSNARQHFDEAKICLTQSIQIDATHSRAFFRLGMMKAANNDELPAALENYNMAHNLAPFSSDILYERGSLHARMGHLRAGVDDKRCALRLDEDSLVSKELAQDILIDLIQKALEDLEGNVGENDLLELRLALLQDMRYFDPQVSVSERQDINSKALNKYVDAFRNCPPKQQPEILGHFISSLEQKSMFNGAYKSISYLRHQLNTNSEMLAGWQQYLTALKAQNIEHYQESYHQITTEISGNSPFSRMIQRIMQRLKAVEMNSFNNIVLADILRRCEQLEAINKNGLDIENDEKLFQAEDHAGSGSRLQFYKTMRVELEIIFTAFSMTRNFGDINAIQHNLQGTLAK